VAVVAVEEAAFLAAVDRVVGGVEVERDDAAPARDAPDPFADEEVAEALGVGLDFFGFAQAVGAEFDAVEGALAGEGFAAISFAAPFAEEVGLVAAQREDGVEPELVVVVDVFVAEGDRVDALGAGRAGARVRVRRVACKRWSVKQAASELVW
jgi:hypothetical protein